MLSRSATRLKFSANLGFLFTDAPNLREKCARAQRAGFQGVELTWLRQQTTEEIVEQIGEMPVVLMNIEGGDGELGYAAWPGMEEEFKRCVYNTVRRAETLRCSCLHVTASRQTVANGETFSKSEMRETYLRNLQWVASVLERHGMTGVIEAINSRVSIPGYFLDDVKEAVSVVSDINSPSIRLMLDLFHAQISNGGLTQLLKDYFGIIRHIQIAQVPGRGEPDTAGELNYEYILELLDRIGYQGYVGCEYTPVNSTTEAGLDWLKPYL